MRMEQGVAVGGPVVRQPIMATNPMRCRRGAGLGTFQGQTALGCDGLLGPSLTGTSDLLSCTKCGLTHSKIMVNGVQHYGAVL